MHPADTRTAILETSAHLYADLGYSAVSMRDVASAMGMTPANLYHHFKNKDDLVRETVAHVFAEKTEPIAEMLEAESRDADRLGLFVDHFVRLLTGIGSSSAFSCVNSSMVMRGVSTILPIRFSSARSASSAASPTFGSLRKSGF
jgi:AcrR family transcriptional regulator